MADNALAGRDLLSLADLTPAELALVLETAATQKRAWGHGAGDRTCCEGLHAAIIMLKPSLRTRVSFEVACHNLGIEPILLGQGDAFSRSESVHDTVKVLERMVDLIVLRTFEHSHVEEVAEHASVPVINALSDDHHPCQGLADLLTISEKLGRLHGVRLAYLGDGANNMANTYLLAGALAGMDVTIGAPAAYQPDPAVVSTAMGLTSRHETGAGISVIEDPDDAVCGADVVVTDTWASMGREDEHAERVKAFAGYTVDDAKMALAAPGAIFMHCLPAHRGEEVTDSVIDSSASVVFDEAENRVWAQQALMSLLIER